MHLWRSAQRSGPVRWARSESYRGPVWLAMKLGPGNLISEYVVFLSSSNDAIEVRERIDGLIKNSVNPALKELGEDGARFYLEKWEHTEARRLQPGEKFDDEFVAKALSSDLMMTLVVDRVGPGTRLEMEEVAKSDTEIAALWFVAFGDQPDTEAASFLNELQDDGILRYKQAGPVGSEESWQAIVRVLIAAAFEAIGRQRNGGDYRERL